MNSHLPRIAITLGDPTGVGPEIVAAAWSSPEVHACCRPLVVGRPEIVRRAVAWRGLGHEVVDVASVGAAEPTPERIPCLSAGRPEAADAPAGRVDARGGQAAYDALLRAIDLAQSRQIDALTTMPLNKAALWAAGHHYPGHTELLAERCGVTDFAMMLYLGHDAVVRGSGGLGVVHVTLHTALRDVFGQLSVEAIVAKIELADRVMRVLKGAPPRVGVCALNPHAGESGLFGDEESRLIGPAVEQARAAGLLVEGPLAADTLMPQARDGKYDAVVAMYHDQGHIALKLLGMHRAVNVTLGLPIVRTSVAHGTAFDLAWQRPPAPLGGGGLEIGSLIEALRVAARLALSAASATATSCQ